MLVTLVVVHTLFCVALAPVVGMMIGRLVHNMKGVVLDLFVPVRRHRVSMIFTR